MVNQVTVNTTGMIDVNPRIPRMVFPNNSLAEVTAAGFLNQQTLPAPLVETDVILLAYDEDVSFFNVSISNSGVITLSVNTDIPDGSITTVKLANGAVTTVKIADLAVTEAKLALDSVTVDILSDNAVTTAKILDENVTIDKLSPGVRPLLITKFGGKHSDPVGGSATVTFSAPGLLGIHSLSAFIESSANAVSIQKVTPSTDTITILCSGAPGACVISWSADDAAS